MAHRPKYIPVDHFMSPMPAIQAGVTGTPEVITDGGQHPVGNMAFVNNVAAGDTFTFNGAVFTAEATTATGAYQFVVGSTLAASIDALVAVLNASTDPLVDIATYAIDSTSTEVVATYKQYGPLPSPITFSSTHATTTVTNPTGGKPQTFISLDTEHTQVTFSGDVADLHLPDGDESQRKSISYMPGATGTVNIKSVTSGHLPGSTVNYALSAAGALVLQFLGGKWRLLLNDGAVAS